MRPRELLETLPVLIKNNKSVLIKGPPGCGKTNIVEQACEEVGYHCQVSHPVTADPTDFKGMPAIVKDIAEFLPFGDLRALLEATVPTVFFLDDLGQAPAVVQAAAMQLLLARRINGHKVSDHVTFAAATNRREDRAAVTGILEPVKSRFVTILELLPNVEDWCAWALDEEIPSEIIAFVRFKPQLFISPPPPTNDIVNRPSPRTIDHMAQLYEIGLTGLEVLSGAVGEGFAVEFCAFLKIFQSLPNIDGILLNPDKAIVPTEPAALYSVATALATRLTQTNADRVLKYLTRLPEEFSVLGVRDGLRVCPKAVNTRAFVEWISAHQDFLV